MSVTPDQDPEQYAKDSVYIDEFAINGEFIRLPTDLAYWNGQYAERLREYLEADLNLDELKGKLHFKHREILLVNFGKATADDIRASVESDAEYVQARMALISAEVAKTRAKGMVEAVGTKKESLISLGANIRQEMGNDPSIRVQHQNAHQRPAT